MLSKDQVNQIIKEYNDRISIGAYQDQNALELVNPNLERIAASIVKPYIFLYVLKNRGQFKNLIPLEEIQLTEDTILRYFKGSTLSLQGMLGKVTNVKSYDKTFVGTDIGMNLLLRPALYGAFHHIVIANDLEREIRGEVDVVGQICESTDKIGKDILFPRAEVGDTVAVFNAGAYVSSMSSNYNGHLRPVEVLISQHGVAVIRNAESITDLVKGMNVPEHLLE